MEDSAHTDVGNLIGRRISHLGLWKGRGEGDMRGGHHFIANGKVYLERCYDCGRENYAPSVASGQCAWCGSKAIPEASDAKEAK